MTKLLSVLLRQANNDRGNAVAIVLLVLAVTSLIGVGMLTQSRIDVKFATSLQEPYHCIQSRRRRGLPGFGRGALYHDPDVRRPCGSDTPNE